MADNIPTTTNASVATDDIGNVHYQRMKVVLGADGVNDGDVSSANPMPVDLVSVAATLDVEQQPSLVVEKIDQASASVTYIGQAAPGTATSTAGWRIQRMSVSGTVTTLEYADGDLNFNNIWDNRVSLSYS